MSLWYCQHCKSTYGPTFACPSCGRSGERIQIGPLESPQISLAQPIETEHEELKRVVREWFVYLDATEESDEGREFHPVSFSCCRAMWVDPMHRLMARMKELSRAAGTASPNGTST